MTVIVMLVILASSPVGMAAPPAGIVTLIHKDLRSTVTGKIADSALDRVDVKIEEAPPLGKLEERVAPKVPRRPLRKVGRIDPETLAREAAEKFRDFEVCRVKVARAARVPLDEVKAGKVSALWTILPTGRTRGTLLFEETDTDLATMKCARRQMNRWRFAPPKGGPVDVEFDYEFTPVQPEAK